MGRRKTNGKKIYYEHRITITDENGATYRKSFYSKKSLIDAKRNAESYMKTIADNEKKRDVITFSFWAEKWLALKQPTVRTNTYTSTYERPTHLHLIPYFGKMKLAEIKPYNINKFFALNAGYLESTLGKLKLCLDGIFESAIDNDILDKNPSAKVKYNSQYEQIPKRTYTEEQATEFTAYLLTHLHGLAALVMLRLGLRCSEACALSWDNVDFAKRTVWIKLAATDNYGKRTIAPPKSKNSLRELPLDDVMYACLYDKAQRIKDASGYIFVQNNTCYFPWYMTHQVYNSILDDFDALPEESKSAYPHLIKDGKIIRLTPHELRHTCGTLMYKKTHDVYAVSRFLGHSDVHVTIKTYVHDDVEDLRAALEKRF